MASHEVGIGVRRRRTESSVSRCRLRAFLCALFYATLVVLCLAPLDHAAAQADFTFTKTANPTTYTEVGQVITYDYVLTNTGDQFLFDVAVTDDRVPAVVCSSNTLPQGGTVTCTGTYTIKSADISAGSVTNTATPAHNPMAPISSLEPRKPR